MDKNEKELLKDIRRWVKIMGIQEARPLIQEILASDDEDKEINNKIIYHLSDGEHSTRDIADLSGVSQTTVSNRQKRWSRVGLLEKSNSNSPWKKVISLEEAGISVPEIPDSEDQNAETGGEEETSGESNSSSRSIDSDRGAMESENSMGEEVT